MSAQTAHALLQDCGVTQLHLLSAATQEQGMWSNSTLQSLLRNQMPPEAKGEVFVCALIPGSLYTPDLTLRSPVCLCTCPYTMCADEISLHVLAL